MHLIGSMASPGSSFRAAPENRTQFPGFLVCSLRVWLRVPLLCVLLRQQATQPVGVVLASSSCLSLLSVVTLPSGRTSCSTCSWVLSSRSFGHLPCAVAVLVFACCLLLSLCPEGCAGFICSYFCPWLPASCVAAATAVWLFGVSPG